MKIKSNLLFFIWIFAFMTFIVNPLYKHIGVMVYSVIEYPPCLAAAFLVIVIPIGCNSLIEWFYRTIRKLLTKKGSE